MSIRSTDRLLYALALIASLVLIVLPIQTFVPVGLSLIEAIAAVSYTWSVWLLARNQLSGWWIGLLGTILYAIVFYQAKLYAEVGLQAFYFFTSLQAIAIWLRGGQNQTEKLVGHISQRWLIVSVVAAIAGVFALQSFLMAIRGAAPFWDALTTIMSLVAHIYLMNRLVESWYLWIVVDIIYVPLYASRGLYLTSVLYAIFVVVAVNGLRNFQRIDREQALQSVAS